jgi:hypothetical protein
MTIPAETVITDLTIGSFLINVPDEALADPLRRIAATRRPRKKLVPDQSQGVQLATLQELTHHRSPREGGSS